MKGLISCAVMMLVFGATAHAQTDGVERLTVWVQGATLSSPGGEEQSVAGGANANDTGVTTRHGFSLRPDRCTWGVSRTVEPDAELGWAVEITPVRVADDAVTFRLAWARTREENRASTQPRHSMQLTLRPGESIPLDSVHRPCASQPRTIGASLKVTVIRFPDPDYDRRLIGLELWLVEKLEDGTERSQPLSLRGLYHRPIAFYFDSITQGAVALDIFGEVTTASGEGTSEVKIVTRSRIFDQKQRPFPRETTANIRIAPNEVVSVQLPQVADASAFASRALSLRVRVRRLR